MARSMCFRSQIGLGRRRQAVVRETKERRKRSLLREFSGAVCEASRVDVVLTRERGKNGKLAELLDQRKVTWLEVPLVESSAGPDREQLAPTLREHDFDWVAITSQEAAAVFVEGWRAAGSPQVRLDACSPLLSVWSSALEDRLTQIERQCLEIKVAVVGKGTGKTLEKAASSGLLRIEFTPSKADAEHLAAELPLEGSGARRVLYPASAKAGSDLERGLAERGCNVRRLNTYDTTPVAGLPAAQLAAARAARVLSIASPSALTAWLALNGGEPERDAPVACIGRTSARAAESLGFRRVFYPDSPGLDGFITAIQDALQSCKEPSA